MPTSTLPKKIFKDVFVDERELEALEQRVAARAKCRGAEVDPEDWFPVAGENEHASEANRQTASEYARQQCAGCPVIASCLQLALQLGEQGQHGVWGGTSARERRGLLRSENADSRRKVVAIAAAAEARGAALPQAVSA